MADYLFEAYKALMSAPVTVGVAFLGARLALAGDRRKRLETAEREALARCDPALASVREFFYFSSKGLDLLSIGLSVPSTEALRIEQSFILDAELREALVRVDRLLSDFTLPLKIKSLKRAAEDASDHSPTIDKSTLSDAEARSASELLTYFEAVHKYVQAKLRGEASLALPPPMMTEDESVMEATRREKAEILREARTTYDKGIQAVQDGAATLKELGEELSFDNPPRPPPRHDV